MRGKRFRTFMIMHSRLLSSIFPSLWYCPASGLAFRCHLSLQVRAGHGAGKPTAKVIAELAAMHSFAAAAMKATWVGLTAPGSATDNGDHV